MRQGVLSHTYIAKVFETAPVANLSRMETPTNMCLLERTGSGSALVPCPRKIGFSGENLSQPLAKVLNE